MTTMVTTPERARLGDIRAALQRLHKVLLDAERIQYERAFGRIQSEFQLLVLAAEDPQFAWLKPLSTLIVRIDADYLGKEELADADLDAIGAEIRALLAPNAMGTLFQRLYHTSLQETPDIVMAHGAVMRALPPVKSEDKDNA
jgi:hypothetical protein